MGAASTSRPAVTSAPNRRIAPRRSGPTDSSWIAPWQPRATITASISTTTTGADGQAWIPDDAADEDGPGHAEMVPGTDVEDVTTTQRNGRETWWARVRPTAAYQPRCSCCALLYGEIAERMDYGGELRAHAEDPGYSYSTQWLVGLDRATGLPVSIEALDGSATGHTLRILAVDDEVPDSFVRDPRR